MASECMKTSDEGVTLRAVGLREILSEAASLLEHRHPGPAAGLLAVSKIIPGSGVLVALPEDAPEVLCPHGVARILGPCTECDPECAALIDGREDRPCPNAHLPDSLCCAAHGGQSPVVSLSADGIFGHGAVLVSLHVPLGMLSRVLSVQVHRLALALEERALVCESDPGWRITIIHGLAQLRIEPARNTRAETEKAAALVRETLEGLGLKHNPRTGRWARE